MRILPLEKNREGVDEALAAIQASLTKETARQLMQMFKRELPRVDWMRSAQYLTAFSIMRRANSTEYCKFIIEQLEAPDASDDPDTHWKNYLITCSITPESKLAEIEPIHNWIVTNHLVKDSVWLKTCSEMHRRISSDKLATQSLAEAMVQALVDCEPLRENDSFWYGSPHGSPGRSTAPSEIWMKVVGSHTMEVWADLDASKERVAIVGCFLQRFGDRMYTSEQRYKGLRRTYIDFDQIEKVLLERLKKTLADGTYLDETAILLDNGHSPCPDDCLIRFSTTAQEKHGMHNLHLDMRTLLGLLAYIKTKGKQIHLNVSQRSSGKTPWFCRTALYQTGSPRKVSLLNSIRQRSGGLGATEVLRRLTLTWPLHESELERLGVAREQVLATIFYCSIRQNSRSRNGRR